ncbi:hypothetical protein A0H81_02352 [Grifola frondosa]|uniref:Uncharacterized protein n=1 Tax=Grifola frondosa TaxID=5627 RepID=A0A1C7MKQ6_GRIFR|nr:hypothetical protein A0H81_02352 [Grifola frondosa]
MYSPNNGPQTLYYVPFLGDEASEDGLQRPIEDEVQRSDLNAVYPYVNADPTAQFGIAPTPMDNFPHGSIANAQHSFPFHSPRTMTSCVYDLNHSEPCQGFALELPLDIQTYLLELCTGSITPNRVPISIYEQLREFCNHAIIHLSSSVQGDDIPRIQPGAGPSMIRRDIDDFASAYPVPHIGANSTTSFSPSGVVGGPNPLQSAHYVSAPSPSSSTGMDTSIIGGAEIGPSVESTSPGSTRASIIRQVRWSSFEPGTSSRTLLCPLSNCCYGRDCSLRTTSITVYTRCSTLSSTVSSIPLSFRSRRFIHGFSLHAHTPHCYQYSSCLNLRQFPLDHLNDCQQFFPLRRVDNTENLARLRLSAIDTPCPKLPKKKPPPSPTPFLFSEAI